MSISAILGGVSILSSFLGGKKTASANKKAALANAEISELNAGFSRENAADVVLAGRELEIEKFQQINRSIGATRAAIAGAGLVVEDGAGTVSQDLVSDMRVIGAMDIQKIRDNVQLERKKFDQQEKDSLLRAEHGQASARSISPNFAGLTAGFGTGVAAYGQGLFDNL